MAGTNDLGAYIDWDMGPASFCT